MAQEASKVDQKDGELRREAVQIADDEKARQLRVQKAREERVRSQPTREQLLKSRHDFLLEQAKQENVAFLKSKGKLPVVAPVVQT